jgi:hypothetical protein
MYIALFNVKQRCISFTLNIRVSFSLLGKKILSRNVINWHLWTKCCVFLMCKNCLSQYCIISVAYTFRIFFQILPFRSRKHQTRRTRTGQDLTVGFCDDGDDYSKPTTKWNFLNRRKTRGGSNTNHALDCVTHTRHLFKMFASLIFQPDISI